MCKASHINPPKINQTNLPTYALATHPLRTGPSPIAYNQAVQTKTASFNLSFTAASLRPELARIIAEIYLQEGNWPAAKARVLASNALQCRTTTSAVRMETELRRRLMHLTPTQLSLLVAGPMESSAAMAWLAALKHINFVFQFAAEVLRAKLGRRDTTLRHSDYETFFDAQQDLHPELSRLTPLSKAKVRQVLYRMLAEGQLLAPGKPLGSIQRPVLSPATSAAIAADDPAWLAGFLVPDHGIPVI